MPSDMPSSSEPKPSKFLRELLAEREALLKERDQLLEEQTQLLEEAKAEKKARAKLKRKARREKTLREEVEGYAKDLSEKVARLELQLAELRRHRFGRRSEAFNPDQERLDFGEEPEVEPPPYVGEAPDDEADEPKKKRNHPGRRPLPDHLPRERETREPPESERECEACGGPKSRISEDVTAHLEFVPASFKVIEIARGRWACPCGEGGVSQEPADESGPVLRGRYGPGLIAHCCVSKYNDHLPNDRQVGIYGRSGFPVPSSTLGDLQRDAGELLKPVVAAMLDDVLASPVVALDATQLRVRDPTKPKPRAHKVKLWVFAGQPGDVYVEVGQNQKATVPREVLGDYRGTIMADGESGLGALFEGSDERERAACLAHARRKFHKSRLEVPELAGPVMVSLRQLYMVERTATEQGLSAEERLELRQSISAPTLEALYETLEAQKDKVRPKSVYGKALAYMLGWREELEVYLKDGRVPIDNNRVERIMKHIAVGRKNWLIAGSSAGAASAARHYSVVVACRELGVDPWEYYKDVLVRLPTTPLSEVANLTPRRWAETRKQD